MCEASYRLSVNFGLPNTIDVTNIDVLKMKWVRNRVAKTLAQGHTADQVSGSTGFDLGCLTLTLKVSATSLGTVTSLRLALR